MNLKLLLKIAEEYNDRLPPTRRTPFSPEGVESGVRPIKPTVDVEHQPAQTDNFGLSENDYQRFTPEVLDVVQAIKDMINPALAALTLISKGASKKDVDRELVKVRKALSHAEGLAATNLNTKWVVGRTY